MSNLANVHKCGLNEVILFLLAIIFGTGCSICSKTMMGLHGTNGTVDETGIPTTSLTSKMKAESNVDNASKEIPLWMYFFLAIPAIFDLAATALCMMGLQYLDVSIYQMLRGSGIIFVALMKQHVLKDHLHQYHWVGVFWNVVSVVIVGGTAMLASGGDGEGSNNSNTSETFWGVCLLMSGAFVQAVQFVFEEHVMTMDTPAPPLLLIGMEGLWGTILSICVMSDHGSYEDPFNTWAMFTHSKNIQVAFFIYFFAIFFYNLFAVLVTFKLSSVWHAILDNFRPITVWGTDLFIFYYINPLFGEVWTQWSYLQIFGMAVLLYGTAIYNAPNAGSLLLEGQWWAFGINLSSEYEQVKRELEQAEIDAKWEAKRQEFKVRTRSSFIESPRISIHTQALRGIGAQHN
ncbi:hypothetical protein QTG54_000360 [Skeletonema marinoi]|uniref:EamA domain-containing protein n=1 Tax=Skeletonema marinoi TaxID=267567 RepID=A0AAD9DHX0_9STRA|nr:hypothetical protein QTG54_000360 [Skeletonema marinoi]